MQKQGTIISYFWSIYSARKCVQSWDKLSSSVKFSCFQLAVFQLHLAGITGSCQQAMCICCTHLNVLQDLTCCNNAHPRPLLATYSGIRFHTQCTFCKNFRLQQQ